jgi:hypothetical protein
MVDLSYDIFEILPDGTPLWKTSAKGRDAAMRRLDELARTSRNELKVIHLESKTVVATRDGQTAHD